MVSSKRQPTDPPSAGGQTFLVVGKVRRPHGVHGEVVAEFYDKFPECLNPKKTIYVGENHVKLIISIQRIHNEGLLLGFEGINTPEEVGCYRNQHIYIAASEGIELSESESYYRELLDLKVVDETGKTLGSITEIIETGANDVYVVTDSSGHELLLPVIPEVIQKIDLEKKIIKVRLIPGLV